MLALAGIAAFIGLFVALGLVSDAMASVVNSWKWWGWLFGIVSVAVAGGFAGYALRASQAPEWKSKMNREEIARQRDEEHDRAVREGHI